MLTWFCWVTLGIPLVSVLYLGDPAFIKGVKIMALVFSITGAPNDTGLKEFIGERTYNDLTDGGIDDQGEQAILEATNLINAKYGCAQQTVDWSDLRVINAGLCYASYYLYSKAEIEAIALDKRHMGNTLLGSIIGVCAFDIDQSEGMKMGDFLENRTRFETPPTMVVAKPDPPYESDRRSSCVPAWPDSV